MNTNVECQNVIEFARLLGMKTTQPPYTSMVKIGCCLSNRITCNSDMDIIEIHWSSMELNGHIEGNLLPLTLKVLDLYNNNIVGMYPELNHLEQLEILNIGSNIILGSIKSFPISLKSISVQFNGLHGVLPPFPPKLEYFKSTLNNFNGSIAMFPLTLKTLVINSNNFTGELPLLPIDLEYLNLGGAPYLNNYNYNKFTGKIVLGNPKELLINRNLITNVVVYNTSRLIECFLQNTPLKDSTTIGNLTMCRKTGIYSLHDCISFIYVANSTTKSNSPNPSPSPTSSSINDYWAYIAISGFIVTIILLFIAKRIFKKPQIPKSRFTRKSSFGSLETPMTSNIEEGRSTYKSPIKRSEQTTLRLVIPSPIAKENE